MVIFFSLLCSGLVLRAQCPPPRLALVTEASSNELIAIGLDGSRTRIAGGITGPGAMVLNPARTVIYLTEHDELSSLDLSTGALRTITGGITGLGDIALNPPGTIAYVTDANGKLSAVTLATGQVTLIRSGLDAFSPIVLNPAGSIAYIVPLTACFCGDKIYAFNLSTGVSSLVASLPDTVRDMAINGTGSTLYASTSTSVFAISVATGVITPIAGGLSWLRDIALDGAETTVYGIEIIQPTMSRLSAVNLSTGSVTTVATGLPYTQAALALSTGESAALMFGADGDLRSVNLTTGAVTVIREELTWPQGVVTNASGTMALVAETGTNATGPGEISMVNLATGEVSTISSGVTPAAADLALDAGETSAYVSHNRYPGKANGRLSHLDLASGTLTTIAGGPTGSAWRGVSLAPGGETAYVAEAMQTTGGRLQAVNLATGNISTVAEMGAAVPGGVAVDTSGTKAYVTRSDGTLVSVDLATGALLTTGVGLSTPEHLALTNPEEFAYVTESGTGELSRVDLSAGTVTLLSGGLRSPNGVGGIQYPGAVATIRASRTNPAEGSQIAACVHINVQGTAESVGSYSATLDWDSAVLQLNGFTGGDPPFDSPVVDTSQAGAGRLSFADSDGGGSCGTALVLCTQFDVVGQGGISSPLDLELTSIQGAGTLNNLLPGARASDHVVSVPGLCTAGDLNDDDIINSGDALLLLSHDVGLPIPPASSALVAQGCGDTDGDAVTNSTDANIVLSFEVDLPIDPGFPIGSVLSGSPTFEACPACALGPLSVSNVTVPQPALSHPRLTELRAAAPYLQGEILVKPTASNERPGKGQEFELTVSVDLTATGATLGSYAAMLAWDPKQIELVRPLPMPGTFSSPVMNLLEAAAGRARFAQAVPDGAAGQVELLRLRLRALRALPHPATWLDLQFTSMATTGPGFDNLLPLVRRVGRTRHE